jgi:hypothetical protein
LLGTAILTSFKPTQRTRVRRVHERGHYDRETSWSLRISLSRRARGEHAPRSQRADLCSSPDSGRGPFTEGRVTENGPEQEHHSHNAQKPAAASSRAPSRKRRSKAPRSGAIPAAERLSMDHLRISPPHTVSGCRPGRGRSTRSLNAVLFITPNRSSAAISAFAGSGCSEVAGEPATYTKSALCRSAGSGPTTSSPETSISSLIACMPISSECCRSRSCPFCLFSSAANQRSPVRGRQPFACFLPAASPKALTSISRTVRRWALHHRSDKSLQDLVFAP